MFLKMTYWRQDLGLGDDAVGKAVLPAFRVDFRPGDLEAGDPLVRSNPGHAPQEGARDVPFFDGEGGRQVLRFGQNFGVPQRCKEKEIISQNRNRRT